MKIDWKELSNSEGYKSLKSAYIRAVSGKWASSNDKRRALDNLNWVISRAKHYSHVTGISIKDILWVWEEKRTYCWLNYYQDIYQPKIKKESVRRTQETRLRNLLACRAAKSLGNG